MQTFLVGGAVRDELLGLPVKERDWVVVGAHPDEMKSRGFVAVGRDFPVFLHPQTKEEHALARTERKTGPGYRGFVTRFSSDVTLEQDLERRDLTINAIARDEQGNIIDPYNGAADLKAGVLRHVSPAFAEDPVRILRTARFAARFGFTIAPETLALMRQMVAAGEADALVPERVWQEVARGLMEAKPSRLFGVLRECGALGRIMPQLEALLDDEDAGAAVLHALDATAAAGATLAVRFAALVRALDPLAAQALAERLKAPAACRDLALLAARHANAIADAADLDADTLYGILEAADAFRRPARFGELVDAALAGEDAASAARARLARALAAATAVDAGAIARDSAQAAATGERVSAARLQAVREALKNSI